MIGTFRISCSDVNHPVPNLGDLNLCYEPGCNVVILESDEAKTPTRLRVWISDDLHISNLAVLLKVMPQVTLSQGVVETTNKDAVSFHPSVFQSLNLPPASLLIQPILLSLVVRGEGPSTSVSALFYRWFIPN